MPEYYIWWQSQEDSERIIHTATDAAYAEMPAWWDLPDWLWQECRSRYGRGRRARLWVPSHIDLQEIAWDGSKPASRWAAGTGGIVFDAEYLPKVLGLPGFVTDLELNLIRGQDVK